MSESSDLMQTADQFAQDLIANNIAGLMPRFTPVGIGQAMAMQQQPDGRSPQGSTSYEVSDQGENLLHITFRGDDGDGAIFTQWVEGAMGWQVDAIGRVD